jgi:hypothetical protein
MRPGVLQANFAKQFLFGNQKLRLGIPNGRIERLSHVVVS